MNGPVHRQGGPTQRQVGLHAGELASEVRIEAFAPGRVNLIGEHTDYTGGLALPMAIDLGTTINATVVGASVNLRSDAFDEEVTLGPTDWAGDPSTVDPPWARFVAAVAAGLDEPRAVSGTVVTTLPVGAGLSSSASFEVALALALGFVGTTGDLALLAQQAEQQASGVPCGLMDQLAVACGVDGAALCIDFTSLDVVPVALPGDLEVVVAHSGEDRTLAGSAYADRRRECEQAAEEVGPLATATITDVSRIANDRIRRRARHVVGENGRVRAMLEALAADDRRAAGSLLVESHRSLADDFEVSTTALDTLVGHLRSLPGVYGARLTGAGFGGCVVALAEPGAIPEGLRTWVVRPASGAWVRRLDA
jgi:galactokinase